MVPLQVTPTRCPLVIEESLDFLCGLTQIASILGLPLDSYLPLFRFFHLNVFFSPPYIPGPHGYGSQSPAVLRLLDAFSTPIASGDPFLFP